MAFELELLVDVHANGIGTDRTTDVIAAGLAGQVQWGTQEPKVFQRVLWPEANRNGRTLAQIALENAARDDLVSGLNKKLELGESNPIVMHPFGEWIDEAVEDDAGNPVLDLQGVPIIRRVMTNRSRIAIDFDNLSDAARNVILNKSLVGPVVQDDQVNKVVDVDGIDRREPADRLSKAGRDAPRDTRQHAGNVKTKKDDLVALLARTPEAPRGQGGR